MPLIGWITEQASRTPEKLVLITPESAVTYRELDQYSSRAAQYIHRFCGPSDVVGVHTRSPVLSIVFLLAVFKSGRVYVNLDPDFPARRLDSVCDQLKIGFYLCGPNKSADLGRFNGAKPLALGLPELDQLQDPGQGAALKASTRYVISTTGTSGAPKLVVAQTDGIESYLKALQQRYPLSSNDCVLGLSALAFDGAFREVFAALTVGAQLVWSFSQQIQNPAQILDMVNQFGVTVLPNLIPSRLRAIAALSKSRGCGADSVRLALFCGESLLAEDVENARGLFGSDATLVNQYGVSEYSMAATWKLLEEHALGAQPGNPSIGHAVNGVDVAIVDENGKRVRHGESGEICLHGPGLSLGYAGSPRDSCDRFMQWTTASGNSGYAYRTGDLGRFMENGEIEFLGRKDDEVNIHGLRVHPLEVEANITRHGGIEACAVVSTPSSEGAEELKAYLVIKPGVTLTVTELRDYLSDYLLPAAVPQRFLAIDSLPLTPNGKTDKLVLANSEPGVFVELGHAYRRPVSETECYVVLIWEELLEQRPIGMDDGFFELGGDSITLFRMLARVESEIKIRIPLGQFLQTATVDNLAYLIDSVQTASQLLLQDESM